MNHSVGNINSSQNIPHTLQPLPDISHSHSYASQKSVGSSKVSHQYSNSSQSPQIPLSAESPLPSVVQRCLGDRSYDKRKNAALEIEALIKSLHESSNTSMIRSIIAVLSKDFCTSMNANFRKGGLIGIAATAIGLMQATQIYLSELLPPVLQCFDDPESRVRYYACESLYNIAKVARSSVLHGHFNSIFDGLCKLYADPDVDVKNGAGLLDRLVKDIVTESDSFKVDAFIPLLQNYIRRVNPYIRQLLVGWIITLDSIPDVSMIDYLPDFLEGLFNMLSDSNREIRQAADSALSEFLREIRESKVIEIGPIISILVQQCHSKDRLNCLTAISWIQELIHHPYSGGDTMLPFLSVVMGSVLKCMSHAENEIRLVSKKSNEAFMDLVRKTAIEFEISPLLDTLTIELSQKDDIPTQLAALGWINMLFQKCFHMMIPFIPTMLPVLLHILNNPSDDVVLMNAQVLSRIASPRDDPFSSNNANHFEDNIRSDTKSELTKGNNNRFEMVIVAILTVFSKDRNLLERRGSLIIRKICVLLNAKSVYLIIAKSLMRKEGPAVMQSSDSEKYFSISFIELMVQTLNLILLSAVELYGLRKALSETFVNDGKNFDDDNSERVTKSMSSNYGHEDNNEDNNADMEKKTYVFTTLFQCWCHDPVSTFSLCLLAKGYEIAYALIQRFSQLEVSVGFLMQIDKLVQLLESPVFVQLRLQLLDVESPSHVYLLKSCYGLLMLLPQSEAFHSLNDRLTTVSHLRENLSIQNSKESLSAQDPRTAVDSKNLLCRFDHVMKLHLAKKEDFFITTQKELFYANQTNQQLRNDKSVEVGMTSKTSIEQPEQEGHKMNEINDRVIKSTATNNKRLTSSTIKEKKDNQVLSSPNINKIHMSQHQNRFSRAGLANFRKYGGSGPSNTGKLHGTYGGKALEASNSKHEGKSAKYETK